MIRKSLCTLAFGLASLVGGTADAQIQTALTATATGTGNGPTQSLGFDFTVNSTLTTFALGVYVPVAPGTTSGSVTTLNTTESLYDITAGTGVGQALLLTTVNVVDNGAVSGKFDYAASTNTLLVGHTYALVALYSGIYQTGTTVGDADVNIVPIGGFSAGYHQGATTSPVLTGFPNLITTNFLYSNSVPAPVPEPASLAMVGMGLAGVVGFGAFRRKSARASA